MNPDDLYTPRQRAAIAVVVWLVPLALIAALAWWAR